MERAPFLSPTDRVVHLGQVFGTPLVVKGLTWLPLTELVAWVVLCLRARRRHPDWIPLNQWLSGGLNMLVMLGSEWGHNLAHAAAACWVGKPMDALRVTLGMPLVVYYQPEEQSVTPRQHIIRALGGPVFNTLLLPVVLLFKRFTRPNSVAGDAVDSAIGMNVFLAAGSLLPIPGIDGGPILKWSLVLQGRSSAAADEVVKKVNIITAAGLGAAAAMTLKKKNWVLGGVWAMLAVSALAIGLGWLKEKK